MKALRSTSLRGQLAVTYAGIALLTAVLLGGILLSVLSGYYSRAETAYLRSAAVQIRDEPLPTDGSIATWAARAAILEQVRIRVYDSSGKLLADSGSPRDLTLSELDVRGGGRHDRPRERRPEPLGGGIFGGETTVASDASLKVGLETSSGDSAGYLVLSEPPTSGGTVLRGIAQAWTVAAVLAVALAGAAGYLLSSRISRPIVALTEASDRMAEGDLSARAPVDRADEVGRLGESFNQMADRMEGTVVALRRFVGDAAHEIGTPLTALRADLELAERASTLEDGRRLIGRALGQADRLESLSQSLLSLSRIEAGDPNSSVERVDLAVTVREAVEAVASRAEQAGLTLGVDVADGALAVLADKGRLQVVFESLLDNAVKFTPEGGSIAVSACAQGEWAVASVSDTGIGIPEAEHADVFSRFHRARNVAAYQGSGLGLAIVLATVERYGGAVSFTSSDAGTTFEIRIPLPSNGDLTAPVSVDSPSPAAPAEEDFELCNSCGGLCCALFLAHDENGGYIGDGWLPEYIALWETRLVESGALVVTDSAYLAGTPGVEPLHDPRVSHLPTPEGEAYRAALPAGVDYRKCVFCDAKTGCLLPREDRAPICREYVCELWAST